MSEKYIMTIESLTRIYDETEVLSNIWLAFYPGAKIGVLGNNGAGKSTLLRIMAGEDKDFMGEVRVPVDFLADHAPVKAWYALEHGDRTNLSGVSIERSDSQHRMDQGADARVGEKC